MNRTLAFAYSLLLVVLGGALIVSVSGCGGAVASGGGQPESAKEPGPPPETPEPGPPPETPEPEPPADDPAPVGPSDDHGDTRATATTITQGSPLSGRLETAADIDFFKVTATSGGTLFAATDVGRVGDPGYPAGTVVRIESAGLVSTNEDSFDAVSVDLGSSTSVEAYVRVSGTTPTRYEVAVWLTAPTETDTSFDIELRNLGTEPTAAQKTAIRAAADVWESVISAGEPYRIVIDSTWECEAGDPSTFGDYVDDIRIDIRLEPIDGPSGTLGAAGPCVWRSGGLPLISEVTFDTDDLGRFGGTVLRRLVVHEMAHALGFGTSVQWSALLENSAVQYLEDHPGSTTLPDTHFPGAAAVREFDTLLDGAAYSGNKVPVENDTQRFGAGGLDGHWRETVFGSELMTAAISTSTSAAAPLSRVTIAALADLGYRVDYTRAGSFALPSTSLSGLRAARAGHDGIHVGDDIRRGPVIVAEYPDSRVLPLAEPPAVE